MYMISYQGGATDSAEPADGVLQLFTWEPKQKTADGTNMAHNNINVHARLQTG